MKPRKHLVVPGVLPAETAEIATFLRATQRQLDHAWSFAAEDDDVDFVLSDLADFGGRCARVRALDEGRHFAVLANPGDDVFGAELVLHRPLSAKALVGLLNHVGSVKPPQPRRLIDVGVTERTIEPLVRAVEERRDPNSTRACFIDIQRVRPCTDLESLVQRGAVLLERPGLQSLLIDPVTDTFHSKARMVDLEPYFLEPVVGRERRRVGGSQLAELRKQHPARPLARLRWLNALLRSNGWLADHLDPSANYRLKRWFALDPDYRKQHRIALTLMRDAPLHRIAASSKAHMADVFDVVNAFDSLGLIVATRQQRYEAGAEPAIKRTRSSRKTRRLLAATAFTR